MHDPRATHAFRPKADKRFTYLFLGTGAWQGGWERTPIHPERQNKTRTMSAHVGNNSPVDLVHFVSLYLGTVTTPDQASMGIIEPHTLTFLDPILGQVKVPRETFLGTLKLAVPKWRLEHPNETRRPESDPNWHLCTPKKGVRVESL